MDSELAKLLVAAILGGGGGGALVRWRMAGAQREALTVETLRGVIEELRTECDRRHEELKAQDREMEGLRQRVKTAEGQVQDLARSLGLGGASA